MSKNAIVGLVCAGVLVLVAIIIFGMGVSYKNQEVELRNLAVAQGKNNEVIYDKVWKILQQKAQITDKYATDFKNIYGTIMNDRYQGEAKGAPMFKWVQEHNPSFSMELYKDLSDAVEGQRAEFARVQARLLDIKREHDNLRQKFPGSMFVGDRPELVIQIVTSGKTKEIFRTGEENDVGLFNK